VPGFNQRVLALKAPAGNYQGLSANAKGVFFARGGGQGPASCAISGSTPSSPRPSPARSAATRCRRTARSCCCAAASDFAIVEAKPKADFDAGKLKLDGMELRVDPKREWAQQYVDAWRILRDWFYDPGMHGQDWNAIRDRYATLLAARGQPRRPRLPAHRDRRRDQRRPRLRRARRRAAGAAQAPAACSAPTFSPTPAATSHRPHLRRRELGSRPALAADRARRRRAARATFILAIDGVSTREVDNVYQLLGTRATRWSAACEQPDRKRPARAPCGCRP
jgi:tricorn protease